MRKHRQTLKEKRLEPRCQRRWPNLLRLRVCHLRLRLMLQWITVTPGVWQRYLQPNRRRFCQVAQSAPGLRGPTQQCRLHKPWVLRHRHLLIQPLVTVWARGPIRVLDFVSGDPLRPGAALVPSSWTSSTSSYTHGPADGVHIYVQPPRPKSPFQPTWRFTISVQLDQVRAKATSGIHIPRPPLARNLANMMGSLTTIRVTGRSI